MLAENPLPSTETDRLYVPAMWYVVGPVPDWTESDPDADVAVGPDVAPANSVSGTALAGAEAPKPCAPAYRPIPRSNDPDAADPPAAALKPSAAAPTTAAYAAPAPGTSPVLLVSASRVNASDAQAPRTYCPPIESNFTARARTVTDPGVSSFGRYSNAPW